MAGVVTQTSSDCSLTKAAGPVKSGVVTFTFVNQSGKKAGLDVERMPEATSYQELVTVAERDRTRSEAGQSLLDAHLSIGSAPSIRAAWDSTPSRTVSGTLLPGSYALVCIATYPNVAEPRLLKVVGPVEVQPA